MDGETLEDHDHQAPESYRELSHELLPMALVRLYRRLAVGAPIELRLRAGPDDHDVDRTDRRPDDRPHRDPSGRSRWPLGPAAVCDLVLGAGFTVEGVGVDGMAAAGRAAAESPSITGASTEIVVRATRTRTLADVVGPGMRLLVCGLNPSLYAADVGVGFARPGNRFWPAALAAGLVSRDRDPDHALAEHGVGMTDLVKRATSRADELSAEEYTAGLARVERLVGWLRPGAVCFLGLAGWRSAVDRRATAGWQNRSLAGVPVYVMPNPSGLNASSTVATLAEHLRSAIDGGPGATPRP